jgi:hypothetical protein
MHQDETQRFVLTVGQGLKCFQQSWEGVNLKVSRAVGPTQLPVYRRLGSSDGLVLQMGDGVPQTGATISVSS